MQRRDVVRSFLSVVATVGFAVAVGASVSAQRGGGAQGPPPTARAVAPVDLAGIWTSIVTEDWRWRMMTPAKGDYPSVPLTAAGRQLADQWDPAKDAAAGEQCRAFGAPAVMRMPGRIRISWENDNTLKVETEAGTQTRLFVFGQQPPASGEKTWQGVSAAQWQFAGGGGGRRGGGPPRPGSLKVVTRGMRPGYVQRNGVPYSENAVVTEYINRANETTGDSWLIVTTTVEDPRYLTARWTRSSHFKRLPDGSTFTPLPCDQS
jgi:hypothetical protein